VRVGEWGRGRDTFDIEIDISRERGRDTFDIEIDISRE
jgi:hypothetical protein